MNRVWQFLSRVLEVLRNHVWPLFLSTAPLVLLAYAASLPLIFQWVRSRDRGVKSTGLRLEPGGLWLPLSRN